MALILAVWLWTNLLITWFPTCLFVHLWRYMSICLFVCLFTSIFVCGTCVCRVLCVCVCVVCMCVYVGRYVSVCVTVCVYVCTYISIQLPVLLHAQPNIRRECLALSSITLCFNLLLQNVTELGTPCFMPFVVLIKAQWSSSLSLLSSPNTGVTDIKPHMAVCKGAGDPNSGS